MECCYPIESSAINYLKKIMRGIDSDLKYGGKTKNPAGINKLKPFLASIDERPGAFVEKDYGNSCVLPIMHIEVHSGKGSVEYKNTLAKLLVVMIDQLRLLRNYQNGLSEIVGFVFPNVEMASFVTKLTLRWTSGFQFQYCLTALDKGNVNREIKGVVLTTISSLVGLDTSSSVQYFIPLSRQNFERFGEGQLIQVSSKSSIIFHGQNKYYKLLLHAKHKETYHDLKLASTGLRCSQLLIHDEVKRFGRLSFLCFRKLPHQPLSRDEAKRCLRNFIIEVYGALDSLHQHLQFAHLDVRLENICYSNGYKAVLIDFDRAAYAKDKADQLSEVYPKSIMYSRPDLINDGEWTNERCDLKQFGKC